MKNIFYFSYINRIGGIETFFYQLAKAYQDWDITVYYRKGDASQIARLSQYVRVVKYDGKPIKCAKAFFNFNTDIIDNVDAEEYGLILHGDYKAMVEQKQLARNRLPIHPKITQYYGVSQAVCDSFEELTGIKSKLVYNPIGIEQPQKPLRLISCTRLSKEKGAGRMQKLASELDAAGIPYTWLVFTDSPYIFTSPNILKLPSRLDVASFIADSDYLVQLSDNEGYCYSIVEALSLGVPIIATDLPVLKELGANETNAIILPFDMHGIPVEKIAEYKFNFTYQPKPSNWHEILAEGKTTYHDNDGKVYAVANGAFKALHVKCSDTGKIPNDGDIIAVDPERIPILEGNNDFGRCFIKGWRL